MAWLVPSAVEKHHHPSSFKVARFIGNNASCGLSQISFADILSAKVELKRSAESSLCGVV